MQCNVETMTRRYHESCPKEIVRDSGGFQFVIALLVPGEEADGHAKRHP